MFQIFLGYVLIFFSLKIFGFDVLPDFIGYFLIFYGLSSNLNRSYKFSYAKPLALVLSIWSLINVLILSFTDLFINMQMIFKVLNIFFSIAALVLTYLILLGYRDIEKSDKVNMKITPAFVLFALNAVTGLTANILVFFNASAFVVKVVSALAMINGLIGFVFVIYLYIMYRNYNIELYNRDNKKEEFWNSKKQDE